MKDQGEFGERLTTPAGKSGSGSSGQLDCAAVELLWAEAAEGALINEIAEQVRAHTTSCASCREKMALARSGHEWLLILKQEQLDPPADMVAKILAKTTGASEAPAPLLKPAIPGASAGSLRHHPGVGSLSGLASTGYSGTEADKISGGNGLSDQAHPAWQHASVVLLRRTVLEPRMALVAAMAFFSITLTLNLMGVRLTRLRAADLEPQSMRRAVTRQYAEANARVVRYYENLRIVYEVESRVHQLRQAAETGPQQQPSSDKSGKRSSNSGRDSNSDQTESHRGGMTANSEARGGKHADRPDPKPVIAGPRFDAVFRPPVAQSSTGVWREDHLFSPIFASPNAKPVAFRPQFQGARRAFSRMHRRVNFSMRRFSTRERRLA